MEFTAEQRNVQDEFDTRRTTDRINELLVHDFIDPGSRAFIESRDMMFLSSVDPTGQPTCSYKGGVAVVRRKGERALVENPDETGVVLEVEEQQANLRCGGQVAQRQGSRLRVYGLASVSSDDPLLETWPGAQVVVRVAVTEVFPNCPRYLHRMHLVERSHFVPRGETPPPGPGLEEVGVAQRRPPRRRPGEGARMSETMVAAVQAAPVLLDKAATLDKARTLIKEAADQGASLVVFPESFVPAYPDWVWRTKPFSSMANQPYGLLVEHAVDMSGPDGEFLAEAARDLGVHLSMGVTERYGSTLYSTMTLHGPDGRLLRHHRKLMPTGGERLVWDTATARRWASWTPPSAGSAG